MLCVEGGYLICQVRLMLFTATLAENYTPHRYFLILMTFFKQKFATLTTVGILLTKELLYSSTKSVKLKAYLNQIADRLTENSTLEDVYEQLSLLADIDESEYQVEKGEILTQKEVEERSKEWLR